MTRPTKATINKSALQHNLQQIKKFAPTSSVLAMIKANAYGHDITTVAHALPNTDAFGVACLEEAIRLRQSGINNPIVLLEGIFSGRELAEVQQHHCDLVIHQAEQIEILQKEKQAANMQLWLKMNSGMQRLGLSPQEYFKHWETLQSFSWLNESPIIMTHFACADDLQSPHTLHQLDCFERVTKTLNGPRSLANSAAILKWTQTHCDWVRPGIMLYGVSPFPDSTGIDFNLKPVMTLQSSLIAIQQCKKGDRIGYGGIWECPEDMPVGVVAIGYGDGYPREIEENTPVLLNGKRLPVVGRVSMDMLTVDLRTQKKANLGDPVILWGDGLPVEEIARCAGTIPYTLLCGISQRVPYDAF